MLTNKDLDNRFSHHPPTPEQIEKYARIRQEAQILAELINDLCPESREKGNALTRLDEVMFHANAAIARNS